MDRSLTEDGPRPGNWSTAVLLLAVRGLRFRVRQTIISVVGVFLGVLALTTIISISNGFEQSLIESILETTGHIQVFSAKEHEVTSPDAIVKMVGKIPQVAGVAPAIMVQGMVENVKEQAFAGTNIKGIDPALEITVNSVGRKMVGGEFKFTDRNQVIIGAELAQQLRAQVGKPLRITIPDGTKFDVKLVGIYKTGVSDFDFHLIMVPLKLAQDAFGFEDAVSHIFVRTSNPMAAREIGARIKQGTGYDTQSWMETHRTLLEAIAIERRVMFVVIFLTLVVAAFGISNVLTMMVMEKYRDIGVLRALGMTPRQVVNVFLAQGLVIGLLGTLGGTAGGFLMGLFLRAVPIRLPMEVYTVDHVPCVFRTSDFVSIALLATAVSLLASYLPARRALKIEPVEAIRYYA